MSAGDIAFKYPERKNANLPSVVQEARDVPVVYRADVVVMGGGVAGVAAALQAARTGLSVALIEVRNHFGFELTGPYKVTVPPYRPAPDFPIADAICSDLLNKGAYANGLIDPDVLKSALHAQVVSSSNIKPYLYALGVGLLAAQGRVCGVVMVNRSGRQIVLAKAVVDATENARLAEAAGTRFARSLRGEKTVRRFARLWREAPAGTFQVPSEIGVLNHEVRIHDAGGKYLEVALQTQVGDNVIRDLSLTQAQMTDVCMAVIRHLHAMSGADDKDLSPGARDRFELAPELFVDEMPVVACRTPVSRADVGNLCFVDPDMFATDALEGLYVAGRPLSSEPEMTGLQALLCSGEGAGRTAAAWANHAPGFAATQPRTATRDNTQVRELLNGPDIAETYPAIREPKRMLPAAEEVDVVVVGGGTSGAAAAIAAAEEGARVALIETLGGLGGTGTYLISTYYWGSTHNSLLSQKIDRRIPTFEWAVGKLRYSGQTKMQVLQDMALKAGVRLYYWTVCAGVLMDGQAVRGVVVENAEGRRVFRAKVVIDASGHGDVAAAAGASFSRGRETDGFMMEMNMPGKGLRDPTNVEDITAFLMKKPASNVVFPLRESRLIEGDYALTFKDILSGKRFPDAMVSWRSNYDTHFPHSANQSDLAQDWMAIMGLFRKPLEGTIPYRCLLPRSLDNLYVVGKAFASDHDAKIAVRMQRDLQQLGEASGVAAALCVRQGKSVRAMDFEDVQRELLRREVLRPADLATDARPDFDEPDIAVQKLGTPDALNGMIDLYRAGAQSLACVRPLMASDNADVRVEAALVLGMLGDRASVPVLLDCLSARHPRIFAYTIEGATKKDSVPVYCSAAILLGRFKEQAAVPHLLTLLKDPETCPPDLASFAIAALGQIGDASAAPVIRPFLRVGGNVEEVVDENMAFERLWGVRTNAAKALAKLGDMSGVPVLIDLLENHQAQVRDYAHRLLREITGQSRGKDRTAWQALWKGKSDDGP